MRQLTVSMRMDGGDFACCKLVERSLAALNWVEDSRGDKMPIEWSIRGRYICDLNKVPDDGGIRIGQHKAGPLIK